MCNEQNAVAISKVKIVNMRVGAARVRKDNSLPSRPFTSCFLPKPSIHFSFFFLCERTAEEDVVRRPSVPPSRLQSFSPSQIVGRNICKLQPQIWSKGRVRMSSERSCYLPPGWPPTPELGEMIDDAATGYVKQRLAELSQGRRLNNDIQSLCFEGLQVVRIQSGSILCNLVVPEHLADQISGNWHIGALTTLIDSVGALAMVSLIGKSGYTATVNISVSFLSIVKIGEEVEIEAKVSDEKEKLSSTIVEIRRKDNAEMVALGKQWLSTVNAQRHLPNRSKL